MEAVQNVVSTAGSWVSKAGSWINKNPQILDAVGTGMQAAGQINQGRAQDAQAQYQAAQLEANAKARFAKGTRDAEQERRRGEILLSNARAAMGASGGTTTDAGAVQTLGGIARDIDYNSLATLYEADNEAAGMRQAAAGKRYEGKLARQSGYMGGLSSIISNYSKYRKRG